MKRLFLFFISFLLCCIIAYGQGRYWVGPSGGNWSSLANWSTASGGAGGAGPPTSVQDAIFDNGFNGTVSYDVASATVNSLSVISNSTVTLTLPGVTGRTITCNNGGAATNAFFVGSGSTLVLTTTTNSLNFTIGFAASSKGQIDGTLIASGAVAGGSGGRIDATGGIVLINGTYRCDIGSSNPVSTVANLTFGAGSVYQVNKNGGTFCNATWNPTSNVLITGSTTTAPTHLSSTVFGNVTYNCAAQSQTVNLSMPANIVIQGNLRILNSNGFRLRLATTLNNLTVNGSFEVTSNCIVSLSNSVNAASLTSGTMIQSGTSVIDLQESSGNVSYTIKGNISQSGGTITESGTSAGSSIILNGTVNQDVTMSGSFLNQINLTMNNTAGATLQTPLVLPATLTLTSGKLTTTSVNLLTMIDNATYTGGSSSCFINGPLKKIGDDDFVFPVGKGSIYAPVGIVGISGAAVTDEFTAEYKRVDPRTVHGNILQSGMNHVSYVEHWSLIPNAVTSVKKVSLKVHELSFCKNLGQTFVSRWDGAQWTSEGSTNGGVTVISGFETGTITSVNNISQYGNFTLITDLPFSANPLPLSLIAFSATALSKETAMLTWELSESCMPGVFFDLQKSTDGRNFSHFKTIVPGTGAKSFSYLDLRLLPGVNYYRLKMTDANGSVSYSKVMIVINEEKGFFVAGIYPNPVSDNFIVNIVAENNSPIQVQVVDLSGRQVKSWRQSVFSGENTIPLKVGDLLPGVYHLQVTNGKSRSVLRFLKQK